MLLMSGMGVIFSLNFMVGVFFNIAAARTLLVLTWLSWIIVGALASVMALRQSARNIRRLGFSGMRGVKWWFEVARIHWIAFLLMSGSLGAAMLFGHDPPPVAGTILGFLLYVTFLSFLIFIVTATAGYLVSFFRRCPARGRCVECVQFFYFIIFSFGSLGAAASYWPIQKMWPDGIIAAVLGFIGAAVMLAGFIKNILDYEKRQAENT
ncbi:MAG: hypothetical protein WEB58_17530 [Planctomycetaceae bacterium]